MHIVVDAALGRPPGESTAPPGDARVRLDVWAASGWVPRTGQPVNGGWWPPTGPGGGDVAVLEVAALPAGVTLPRLQLPVRGEVRSFIACGFPPSSPDGIFSYGQIYGLIAGAERTRMVVSFESPMLSRGYSGRPLLDVGLGAVVGIAVATNTDDPNARVAIMIPLDKLAEY